ncbi:MAG: hypothetical protein ACLGIM_19085 [Alphaproteobacteria bacterium]
MALARNPDQLTGDVLRLGTIASVDHANATCTVESGDILTGELPWAASAKPLLNTLAAILAVDVVIDGSIDTIPASPAR